MKFKVTRNIRPNMFGKITGSTTLAGTEDCPYDIEWLIDEIVSINYFGVKDDEKMQEVRDFLLEQLKVLEVNSCIKEVAELEAELDELNKHSNLLGSQSNEIQKQKQTLEKAVEETNIEII